MEKNILFIVDDLELKYFEFNDLVTDFWFIKEFLKRDYNVRVSIKRDLFIENAQACVFSRNTFIKGDEICYDKKEVKSLINDFDVVFFRPDPPVDINFIDSCYVFDYVDKEKTLLINDPTEVKNFNEKFHVNYFPQYAPKNIVSSNVKQIIEFVDKEGEAILKPLNRCFSSGVYYLNKNDRNVLTIVNAMTEDGKTPVMVQKYLPKAVEGDKRVLMIGDKVMSHAIRKLPADHDFKFSNHCDKFFKPEPLSENERNMAQDIANQLSKRGIYLVGLDVIDEKIIEINVTSPCYFIREIDNNYGIHFEDEIMASLEELITKHFAKERVYANN